MQIKQGMVVKSAAGHDKNSFYVVVKQQGEFLFIADGKRRKLLKPKRKNNKHLFATQSVVDLAFVDTDKKLRRVLHSFNNDKSSIAE